MQSYGILKTAETSNLKAHNNEKMAVKKRTIFQHHLNELSRVCPKNVVLMKTKNNTFFTFLDKMQFSAIL